MNLALNPSLPQLRDRAHDAALAASLAAASLADLATLTGLLAAECCRRHVQVAGPLGLVAARLEMLAAKEGSHDR